VLAHAAFVTARALDFIRANLGYMNLPVKLVGFACGYGVGYMGATHYACDDIAQIRSIPGITILSPADAAETVKITEAVALSDKPVYIRLPGVMYNQVVYTEDYDFHIGKSINLKDGKDIAIIATGPQVSRSLKAAELLEGEGLSVKVINMHTIRPLDTESIDACLNTKFLVTAEEHGAVGGLGSAVAEYLALKTTRPPHLIIGTLNEYIGADLYEEQCKITGLDAQSMKEKIILQYRMLYC
jgi:transketolase